MAERTRVIIADDESIIRMDLREMLTNLGYLVIGEVGDGRSAVNLSQELKPDVVIMDIKFEGDEFDGIDAARVLTEERIAPVLLLTAYSQRELVVRAREAGVVGYLVKPFREADIFDVIHKHLGVRFVYEEPEQHHPRGRTKPEPGLPRLPGGRPALCRFSAPPCRGATCSAAGIRSLQCFQTSGASESRCLVSRNRLLCVSETTIRVLPHGQVLPLRMPQV